MDVRNTSTQYMSKDKGEKAIEISKEKIKYDWDGDNSIDDSVVSIQTNEATDIEEAGEISEEKVKYDSDRDTTIDDSVVLGQTNEENHLLEIFPFVCGLCYCKFSKMLTYYEHLRQHGEVCKEKLFHCDKECKENTSAKFQPYLCAICNIGFVTICQLHFHIIEEENMHVYVYEHGSRMAGLSRLNFGHQSPSSKVSEQSTSWSKLTSTIENTEEANTCIDKMEIINKSTNKNLNGGTNTCTNESNRINDCENNHISNIPEICKKRNVSKCTKSRKHDNVDTMSTKHLLTQMLQSASKRKYMSKSASDKITKAPVDFPVKQECVHGIYEEPSKEENDTAGKDVSEPETVAGEAEPKSIFRQIEKHQVDLKKRRKKYSSKVKDRTGQKKIEKSAVVGSDTSRSINCIKNEQNSDLYSTNTFNHNEEDQQALVEYMREKTCAISSTVTTDKDNTGCKTETDEKGREILPQDDEHQTKKLKTKKSGQKIPAGDVLVTCHICGRMYKKRHLKKHLVSHQETRSFPCDVCNKYYKTKQQLYLHKDHHVKERNFVCRYCGKAFNTKGNLRQHERSHTAKKIYQCPFCPDKFASPFILKCHSVIHSDAKPFICDVCNQGFKRKDQLHRHQLVHTDKRPFSCSVCKKAFKTKRDCSKHEAIHQPAKHFCGYCNKGFVSKSNMRIHERIHTREIK